MQIQILAKRSAVIVLFSVLAGCGLLPDYPAKWTHPTNSPAKINSDHRECAIDAWKRYPKKLGMVTEQEGYWDEGTYPTTTCQYNKYTKSTHCISNPGIPRKWVEARIVQGDANAKIRTSWYSECMKAKDPQYKCVKNFSELDGTFCGHHGE